MTNVTFGAIQVREFERIAGNHPDVPRGPSLSIGWGFVQKDDVPITVEDAFENEHSPPKALAPLNAETRRFLLAHVFDISKQDIETSEELAEEVRTQRKESYWVWKQHLKEDSEEEEEEEDDDAEQFHADLILRPKSTMKMSRRPTGTPAILRQSILRQSKTRNSSGSGGGAINANKVRGIIQGVKRSLKTCLQTSLHRV